MNYALVEGNIVVNLIWLHPMNADEFPNAKPTNGLPIHIGDTFVNGKFYHDGKEVAAQGVMSEEYIQQIKDQAIAEVQQEVSK